MKLLFVALLVICTINVPAQLTLQSKYYSHKQQCSFIYAIDQKCVLEINADHSFFLTKTYSDSRFRLNPLVSHYSGTWEAIENRVIFNLAYSSNSLITLMRDIVYIFSAENGELRFFSSPKFSDFPSLLSPKIPSDF